MKTKETGFWESQRGTVLIETLILMPVFVIFTIGILEFGNVLWQRQQLQTGVRDAARYWSRCNEDGNCSVDIAENIAFYGMPAPPEGSNPRVPDWNGGESDHLVISPAEPEPGSQIVVSAEVDYFASPLLGALQIPGVTISYSYTQRYIGW